MFGRLQVNSSRRQPPARSMLISFSRSPLHKGHRQEHEGAGLHSLGRVSSPGGICLLTLEISPPPAQEEARECRPTFTKSSISGSLSSPLAVAESVIPSAPRTTVPGRRGATSAALLAPAHSGGLSSARCLIFFFLKTTVSHQFLQQGERCLRDQSPRC